MGLPADLSLLVKWTWHAWFMACAIAKLLDEFLQEKN